MEDGIIMCKDEYDEIYILLFSCPEKLEKGTYYISEITYQFESKDRMNLIPPARFGTREDAWKQAEILYKTDHTINNYIDNFNGKFTVAGMKKVVTYYYMNGEGPNLFNTDNDKKEDIVENGDYYIIKHITKSEILYIGEHYLELLNSNDKDILKFKTIAEASLYINQDIKYYLECRKLLKETEPEVFVIVKFVHSNLDNVRYLVDVESKFLYSKNEK